MKAAPATYQPGDRVRWQQGDWQVVAVADRLLHPRLPVEVPLRSLAYRIVPAEKGKTVYGHSQAVAFADELRLLRRARRARTSPDTHTTYTAL